VNLAFWQIWCRFEQPFTSASGHWMSQIGLSPGALQHPRNGGQAQHQDAAGQVEPGEVEDIVMGCAMQQGTTAMNVARKGAIRAGLPVTVAGTTIDRQCASGLQAIAVAARSVMLDGVKIAVAGGIESISLVQNEHMNKFHAVDDGLMAMKPAMYISMLETAEALRRSSNESCRNLSRTLPAIE